MKRENTIVIVTHDAKVAGNCDRGDLWKDGRVSGTLEEESAGHEGEGMCDEDCRKEDPQRECSFIFSFTAISPCLLPIVSAIRAEKVNRLNKYTMYSGHQKGFSVSGGDGVEQWEPVISSWNPRMSILLFMCPWRIRE